MAQFQVPQFIEIEQKIIGGILTMRQFLILSLGGGIIFLLFLSVKFFIWIILSVIIGVGIFAMSFLKLNGRSFSSLMKAAFFYYWNPSFYLWKSEDEYAIKEQEPKVVMDERREEPGVDTLRTIIPKTFGSYLKSDSKIHIGKEISGPSKEIRSAQNTPAFNHKEARDRLKIGEQIQSLWEKISTSRDLIPKRESRMNVFQKERVEAGYQTMRRSTGEIEVARRVDFK